MQCTAIKHRRALWPQVAELGYVYRAAAATDIGAGQCKRAAVQPADVPDEAVCWNPDACKHAVCISTSATGPNYVAVFDTVLLTPSAAVIAGCGAEPHHWATLLTWDSTQGRYALGNRQMVHDRN